MVVAASELDADDVSLVSLFNVHEIEAFQERLPCSQLGSAMVPIPPSVIHRHRNLNRMRVAERPQKMEESGQVVCV